MTKVKNANETESKAEDFNKKAEDPNNPEETNQTESEVRLIYQTVNKVEDINKTDPKDPPKSNNTAAENSKINNGKTPFFEEKNAFPVYITQNNAIFVDKESGEILGPVGEGTLGIIIYGGDPTKGFDPETGRLRIECAVKIPRLLHSNNFLNFNIAEIANYEGIQANKFSGTELLLGANNSFRLNDANVFTKIPTSGKGNCYIGFYLATNSKYKICLVSKDECWPKEFKKQAENQNLFEKIQERSENKTDQFDNLLFFRDEIAETRKSSDKLQIFSREGIYSTFRQKNINGWWFNLPLAIYPWMSCDLERILTAYVNEGLTENIEIDQNTIAGIAQNTSAANDQNTVPETNPNGIEVINQNAIAAIDKKVMEDLKKWELSEWFRLFLNLCNGILNLHNEGCIHGDPRPANIMTKLSGNMDLMASSFRWIDIALGYDTGSSINVINLPDNIDARGTTIIPRPLGGGRTTPFYAPERMEGLEYEDADSIQLELIDHERFRLKFLYKHNTFVEPKILQLKQKGTALCELGTLNKK